MSEVKVLEIMGHTIDLGLIENPALKRAIRQRIESNDFMFRGYGDHEQYKENKAPWKEKYKEHKENYPDHHEHRDYVEASGWGNENWPESYYHK